MPLFHKSFEYNITILQIRASVSEGNQRDFILSVTSVKHYAAKGLRTCLFLPPVSFIKDFEPGENRGRQAHCIAIMLMFVTPPFPGSKQTRSQ